MTKSLNLTLVINLLISNKFWRFRQILLAFSEYMNFTALHYAVILVQQSVLYALFALLCFLFATLKDFAVLLHQKRDQ